MGILKRAAAGILRRKGKSVLLLVLVFVLMVLIVGGMSARRAVIRTEENLWRNLSPLTAIEFDRDAWMAHFNHLSDYEEWHLTAEFAREIGALSYVNRYSYSMVAHLNSFEFENYQPEISGSDHHDGIEGMPTFVALTGVSNPDVFYIEYRADVAMVDGRTFSEQEMRQELPDVIPIVISEPLAAVNQLSVGSTFTVYAMLPNTFDYAGVEGWLESNLLMQEPYTFEVIGLFDLVDRRTDLSASRDEDWNEYNAQWSRLNDAFVPIQVADAINVKQFEASLEAFAALDMEASWFDPDAAYVAQVSPLFILNDASEIEAFRAAVEPLLPDYYVVSDLSDGFGIMQSSMQTMLWISDAIFIASIVATVLILSLVITLSLHERRYEIGIYLALGEKKSKVRFQVAFEIMATALVGITLAVGIGGVASNHISQALMRTQLTASVEPEARTLFFDGSRTLETMGFVVEMSPDEILLLFEDGLDWSSAGMLYGVGIGTIFVSTLVPLSYIVQLRPKKILMEAKK